MIAVNIIVQGFIQTARCSQIIVRVQAIEDPHNQIIVRVRTCGPLRDRRLCLSYFYHSASVFHSSFPVNCKHRCFVVLICINGFLDVSRSSGLN